MSKVCELTGKKAMKGNNVSHSNAKTKRRFHANLQVKRLFDPVENKWYKLKVSASALRTMSKKGVHEAIKEAKEKGFLIE